MSFHRASLLPLGLLLLTLCSCQDAHNRDWDRVKDYADDQGNLLVAQWMHEHLKQFPSCKHQPIIEDYYVRSCRTQDIFCAKYLLEFPHGSRTIEVETNSSSDCSRRLSFSADSKVADEANGRLEDFCWLKCLSGRCSGYIRTFPTGRHIEEARQRQEEYAWATCINGDCSDYIQLVPKGKHIKEARERQEFELKEARRQEEEMAWAYCGRGNCFDYLTQYPKGEHVKEARRQHEVNLWNQCVYGDGFCTSYIEQFPGGSHIQEARDRARKKQAELAEIAKKAAMAAPQQSDDVNSVASKCIELINSDGGYNPKDPRHRACVDAIAKAQMQGKH